MNFKEFPDVTGFDWDAGNINKNWEKHSVFYTECEELFFNKPLIFSVDKIHSDNEVRFYALGQTNQKRYLFVVFTIRIDKLRVILARDMNKKERKIYNEKKTENS